MSVRVLVVVSVRGRSSVAVVMSWSPCSCVLKINLSVSHKAHCFWRSGQKAQNSRGSAVKDWPNGGHRPAQARHERGRLGGSRSASVAPILDGTGEGVPQKSKESSAPSGIQIRLEAVRTKCRKGRQPFVVENRANSEPKASPDRRCRDVT